jgi:predicted metal-binding membrane protein
MSVSWEAVLRRDRWIIIGVITVVVACAWGYVLSLAFGMNMPAHGNASSMAAMPMAATAPQMSDMNSMLRPAMSPWGAPEFALLLIMWTVMMIGMMTPSATPMLLIYARVAREAGARGHPFAATAWFAGGYLTCWAGFAVVATSAQWGLERAALITAGTGRAGAVAGGCVLLAAGLYQLTSLKNACLSQCQSPLFFIHRHGGFRPDAAGAFRLGLTHGAYCVGCCWALMTILFAVGVMNVLWIAGLTVLVLVEKLAPPGRVLPIVIGTVLSAAGLWLLADSGLIASIW